MRIPLNVPPFMYGYLFPHAIKLYAAYSYLYYEKDFSAVPDSDFDELCVFLLENYDYAKGFDINNYLNKGSLKAGTGFDLFGKVTGLTREFAESLMGQ